eukprot:scaffold134281_cov34-Prasinocladus_malaysianus.AAC.1
MLLMIDVTAEITIHAMTSHVTVSQPISFYVVTDMIIAQAAISISDHPQAMTSTSKSFPSHTHPSNHWHLCRCITTKEPYAFSGGMPLTSAERSQVGWLFMRPMNSLRRLMDSLCSARLSIAWGQRRSQAAFNRAARQLPL